MGGGFVGRKTAFFLQWAGVQYDGFVIDQPWIEKSEKMLFEHPVFCTQDVISKEKCNLIVAFLGFDENQANEIKENSLVQNIFDLDFSGRFCLTEEISFPLNQKWIRKNETVLDEFYNSLADERSRNALDEFLAQRIRGNRAKPFDSNQYFPSDIISLRNGEVFIDCGAFHGETSLDFAGRMGKKGLDDFSIVAFEPDARNAEIMKKNLSHLKNVQIETYGVYSKSTTLHFSQTGSSSSYISEDGDIQVKVRSIDDVLQGKKGTFIKMDIEGSELEALKGAAGTIKKYKPRLAICIYHKRDDLITIPQYIKSLNGDYSLYVRNHSPCGVETVLYAV